MQLQNTRSLKLVGLAAAILLALGLAIPAFADTDDMLPKPEESIGDNTAEIPAENDDSEDDKTEASDEDKEKLQKMIDDLLGDIDNDRKARKDIAEAINRVDDYVEELYEQAADLNDEDSRVEAKELLNESWELLEEAEEAAEDDDFDEAEELVEEAYDLADEAEFIIEEAEENEKGEMYEDDKEEDYEKTESEKDTVSELISLQKQLQELLMMLIALLTSQAS